MATKKTSVPSKSFSETLIEISHRFPLHQVFEDFLTMAIAASTQNPATGKSWYEEEYLATIEPYKDSDLRFLFPLAFGQLVCEMQAGVQSSQGMDVLGEFFEQHISNGRNGQYFTPYPICQLIASMTLGEGEKEKRELNILDTSCGSGRMLLASHYIKGPGHHYYGIDIDRICVKMAAINLFYNGMWGSEVMCANALAPGDFVCSYKISLLPFGIFKVTVKEESALWKMHQESFKAMQESTVRVTATPFHPEKDQGTQLDLFGTKPQ